MFFFRIENTKGKTLLHSLLLQSSIFTNSSWQETRHSYHAIVDLVLIIKSRTKHTRSFKKNRDFKFSITRKLFIWILQFTLKQMEQNINLLPYYTIINEANPTWGTCNQIVWLLAMRKIDGWPWYELIKMFIKIKNFWTLEREY